MGPLLRRGDIYWIDLEPVRGSEANKTRPAVIVSNDGANRTAERKGRGVVTVVPITSDTQRVLSFHVLLTADECGLANDSKAQPEQIRVVSIERVHTRIGTIPAGALHRLNKALRMHLTL